MKRIVPIPVAHVDGPEGRRLLSRIEAAQKTRSSEVDTAVATVLSDIRNHGDRALFSYTQRFEKRTISARTVRISRAVIDRQAAAAPAQLQSSIRAAAKRIRTYHLKQRSSGFRLKTAEALLSQRVIPLKRVGVYVPGGYTSYPSSVLMNVIPAQVAGVAEIAAVTPVKDTLDPAVAFALHLLGIGEVYQVGGSQAVAALAYGTASIRQVDKIVGPGNAYVAAAKRMVYGVVDIDSVAGPSDVAIVADSSARPQWVALDMLAQAEHGSGDETAICITESMRVAKAVASQLRKEIAASPRVDILSALPPHALSILVCKSRRQSLETVNRIAPEHLQIMTRSCRRDVTLVRNSGAIFLGHFTPVALGDYFVGTNHVLPTGGTARFASGLNVDDFIKKISVAQVGRDGLRASARHVSRFARAEQFIHHALSVECRTA